MEALHNQALDRNMELRKTEKGVGIELHRKVRPLLAELVKENINESRAIVKSVKISKAIISV